MILMFFLTGALLTAFTGIWGADLAISAPPKPLVLRIGHFPNLTHAQALVAHGLSRQGKGWFEERLGPHVRIDWYVYNAGPSAMEALFADSLDLAYVGPSPTINAYIKSEGKEIRIVAGACSGGAALVVQPHSELVTNQDFKGKKIGTPQLGNTQDIACRTWLRNNHFKISLRGGDVLVIPTDNSDQLGLFQQRHLDAVWTVEPWVSRLEFEAGAKLYLEESTQWPQTQGKYVTAHLVSSAGFLKEHPEILKKWIAAHVELTQWIERHPEAAKQILNTELKKETMQPLPKDILDRAWKRLEITYDPIAPTLIKYAADAYALGFFKAKPDLSSIYALHILNAVLKEKGLDEVQVK